LKKILPIIAVISAAILWSFDGFLRQELFALSAIIVVALEHGFGTLLFIPYIIKNRHMLRGIGQRTWMSLLWVSIIGGLLGTFFYTTALSYVNYIELSVVVLLQKLQPIFAILLASIVLKEKLTKRFVLLGFIALIGGYLVTFGNFVIDENSFSDDKKLIAALLALLAAFAWGSSTVLGKHALKKLDFKMVTALRLLLTTVFAFIIVSVSHKFMVIQTITNTQWIYILIIVFSTGSVALFIYYFGLKQLPASHTTLYELAWPFSAIIIDYFRGKELSFIQIIGAILLLIAIVNLKETQEKLNG
jgi:drug/metabolite transporter (DMT)-like permease